ncbi:MAG: hypothetical protein ACRDJE_27765 [Dehalococcoidia bacterium]
MRVSRPTGCRCGGAPLARRYPGCLQRTQVPEAAGPAARTDATHILGALRVLNRLARLAEALRAALHAVAAVASAWLRDRVPPDWFERYGRRIKEYRLPKGTAARQAYAAHVSADRMQLLIDLWDSMAPPPVRRLPAVDVLRRTWIQQYVVVDGELRLREPRDTPASTDEIESPYEPDTR